MDEDSKIISVSSLDLEVASEFASHDSRCSPQWPLRAFRGLPPLDLTPMLAVALPSMSVSRRNSSHCSDLT